MENPRKSALRDSKGNNSVHQDGDFPTRKSATRESKGNNSSHSSDHAGTNGDTPKQQTKKTTRESKGNNLIIRTPDGKINDAAPSPANRRRVAAVDGDGKEKQKGILKNGDNKKSKEGQRRRVTKPQDGNTANVKRPKLKKKSAFEKFGQMFGIGVGNVVINDPYALEVPFSFLLIIESFPFHFSFAHFEIGRSSFATKGTFVTSSILISMTYIDFRFLPTAVALEKIESSIR